MTVNQFMKKLSLAITVQPRAPKLAESYYKVKARRMVKGFKEPQMVDVNDPSAHGYTITLKHPKTTKSITLPHFTPPRELNEPTGELFLKFMVSAANGGFPEIQPVKSNLLVLKHWLGSDLYEELISCEV